MDSTFNFKSCKELIHSGCSELTYVIDGLLAQGVYLLAAPPKTGKTWMALDMAISVSSGTSFIGRKTTQGTVLYLSYDDNENRITRRLKKMGCKDDTDVYFDFDPTSKSVEDDFLALISCAKETLPNLSFVVVDVLN